MKTLTVICPVYNEEEVIGTFYHELSAVLRSLDRRYQSSVLFVADRGTDNTLEILRDLARRDKRVRVLALSSRFGHQMALLAGMDHCDSDAVIMMDSDLQHPPALLPRLLEEFEKGFEVVYTIREQGDEVGLFKRWSSALFYRVVNLISDIPIDDSAADFRLVSRKVLRVFQEEIRERNQFLRGLMAWIGFKRTGIAFQVNQRAAGRSKYSLRRLFRFARSGIISFSKRPLQAATTAGLVCALLGVAMAAFTIYQYFTTKELPTGWATLVVLISFFSGINLIFLGILGEYIGAIFDEVKARPPYLVEEKINFAQSTRVASRRKKAA